MSWKAFVSLVCALPKILWMLLCGLFVIAGPLRRTTSTPRLRVELRDLDSNAPIAGMIINFECWTLDRGKWLHGTRDFISDWRGITDSNGVVEVAPIENASFSGTNILISAKGVHPFYAGPVLDLRIPPYVLAGTVARENEDMPSKIVRAKDGVIGLTLQLEPLKKRLTGMQVRDSKEDGKPIGDDNFKWLLTNAATYYQSKDFQAEIQSSGPTRAEALRGLREMTAVIFSRSSWVAEFNEDVFIDPSKFVLRRK